MAEQENKTFMKAILRSSKQPTEQQLQKLQQFLQQKHNATVELSFLQDDTVRGGFKIELGANSTKFSPEFVYDWSLAGKAEQLKEKIAAVIKNKADVMPLIRQTVADFAPTPQASEVGSVLTVGDGIATVSGLDHAEYGEILVFSGGIKGMILDLKEQEIGCVLFGDEAEICEGSPVHRTGKVAGIPVGEAFIGRVVDALGSPIDGKGPIAAADY